MGVHIGDEPAFIFPTFIGAACDEIFDRAKEKFYGKKIEMLSRVPAGISGSKEIFIEKFVRTAHGSAGSFLLDIFVFYVIARRRGLFLEQLKKSRSDTSTLKLILNKSNMFSDQTKQYAE